MSEWSKLAGRALARGRELSEQHHHDDASLLRDCAAQIENDARSLVRFVDLAVRPPIMFVPTTPEDVADASRYREFIALPWWRRVLRAIKQPR